MLCDTIPLLSALARQPARSKASTLRAGHRRTTTGAAPSARLAAGAAFAYVPTPLKKAPTPAPIPTACLNEVQFQLAPLAHWLRALFAPALSAPSAAPTAIPMPTRTAREEATKAAETPADATVRATVIATPRTKIPICPRRLMVPLGSVLLMGSWLA